MHLQSDSSSRRTSLAVAILWVWLFVLSSVQCLGAHDVIVYQEDFEDGQAQDWDLQGTWAVVQGPGGNWVLSGSDHYFATYNGGEWGDYTFTIGVKLIQGTVHINWRLGSGGRYYLGFQESSLYLNKEKPWGNHQGLTSTAAQHQLNQWYEVKVVSEGGQLDIYVDDQLRLSYTDPDPCLVGKIALETLDGSEVYVDDIVVLGEGEPFEGEWVRTGGPPGGLGYDIRYRFDNPTIWYVTDAFSGAYRSMDDGATWAAVNEGISERVGPSGDGIPVFSLTIDPHNPQIIWVGTQSTLGIYKSTDGGMTWTKKVNGITDPAIGFSVRGFTVHPNDSNTIYAQAELSSGNWAGQQLTGKGFDMTMGVVYRTEDGGDSWTEVWRGDNLTRYVWINPLNPDVIYISTGIFDRDAANSDPVSDDPGGVGIVKSTDGGATWTELNGGNGLGNLYIGSLFMHPTNPDILLAGAGNNSYRVGSGVYLTTDGGATWTLVLDTGLDAVTSVEFAISDPLIAYAGTQHAFFRSTDGGLTWVIAAGGPGNDLLWGPPGRGSGFPIDFQVDPANPYRVFSNNYGGGNYLSVDGGTTWVEASRGYTGAQIRAVDVSSTNPNHVYITGRSGHFRSLDAGGTWAGLHYPQSPAAGRGFQFFLRGHRRRGGLWWSYSGSRLERGDLH